MTGAGLACCVCRLVIPRSSAMAHGRPSWHAVNRSIGHVTGQAHGSAGGRTRVIGKAETLPVNASFWHSQLFLSDIPELAHDSGFRPGLAPVTCIFSVRQN